MYLRGYVQPYYGDYVSKSPDSNEKFADDDDLSPLEKSSEIMSPSGVKDTQ